MAQGWPYFRFALNNIQMSMAKADLLVSREYAGLVADKNLADRIMRRLESEFELARRWLLKICGGKELLDHEPRLQESIQLRNPYVDPLSLIQVELLRRIRRRGLTFESAHSVSDRFLLEGLILSINGVSAGLRNTG
jgi:phosphoenolpyruvate carboxylase